MLTDKEIRKIAVICHNLNNAFCKIIGEPQQPEWGKLPSHIKLSAINGVKHIIENPSVTPEESHDNWCRFKEYDGWKYGVKKDEKLKTHPNLVSYKELSPDQKFKDHLFRNNVLFFVK